MNEKIEQVVAEIKGILQKELPYTDIPKLPELVDRFKYAYSKVLEGMQLPVRAAIKDAEKRVFAVLNSKEYKEEFEQKFQNRFKELDEKVRACNNVATLQNVTMEADALKLRLLNEMTKKDEEIYLEKRLRQYYE